MTFKIIREQAYSAPPLKPSDSVKQQVADSIERSILTNIKNQKQADGQQLKANAPSTQRRKRMLGRRVLSLVDELHRFVKGLHRSWSATYGDKWVEVRPANPELSELSESVQQRGYTGWFAVNKDEREKIRAIWRKFLSDWFKKTVKHG